MNLSLTMRRMKRYYHPAVRSRRPANRQHPNLKREKEEEEEEEEGKLALQRRRKVDQFPLKPE